MKGLRKSGDCLSLINFERRFEICSENCLLSLQMKAIIYATDLAPNFNFGSSMIDLKSLRSKSISD